MIQRKMHAYKLKPVFCLAGVTKTVVRTATVNATQTDKLPVKSCKDIPGPSSLPLVGPMLHFLPGGDMHNLAAFEFGEALYKKYGPIVKLSGSFGRDDIYLLFDAEASAQVLRSENWLPTRPGMESLVYYRKSTKKSDQPTGLVSDQGEHWKQFRSTVNPVMLQPKTIKLYRNALDEVALDMVKRMKSNRGDDNILKGKFDMEMNLWSLESIGLVALGRRLNCFDPNLPPDSPAKKLIQVVRDIFEAANDLDFKPSLWRYYSTKAFKNAMRVYEEQEKIAKYFIDKTILDLKSGSKTKPDDEKGVLEKLLDINEDVALIMASDMLLAGVDTTSNTMTATLYLLANNQERQDKLREEILSKSEKRTYLKACLKESLRMMPVVTGNARRSTKDYTLLGYHIPKGSTITFMHQAMSILEEYYPRPKEYLPERWIVGKDDPLFHGNSHPFAYNPFGFGVRSCIGRRIAELELETFLYRLIENFKVEWFGAPIQATASSLNYITGPYNFVFKDV
ncbi:cytochrome P450 CYP12A2-like [Ostrinia furnacalis]|uniref:cytochrome P450 CYP12A2-like n=1 Tax=Ostrinia furnacalis TaxID=93504 RepID=UPI00103C090B|nr:cytochrome P450 CYP12A2-like [Ostrinia furnacalis]